MDADLTQETVAEKMDWSLSKIIRIETGSVGISTNDLMALLRLYHIENPRQIDDLIALAKVSRQHSWYSDYRGILSPTLSQYIEYEASASIIRSYESLVVPGLLQTEDYARTLLRLYRSNPEPEEVEPRLRVRMKRQELLLSRPDPPTLFCVLDEAVIRRLAGDEATRKDQMVRLIEAANSPDVTIEIVPFSVGLHSGMGENFSILEFSEPSDSDVLYFETARSFLFSGDDDEEIIIYRELFEKLRESSLGPESTLRYLVDLANSL